MPAERIDSLTGLRFFAAFGILLHHFAPTAVKDSPTLLGFLESLSSCVSFFFVLSGFILVHSYQAITRKVGWKQFMIARVARVYPLYLLALIIMAFPFLKYPTPFADWQTKESILALASSVFALQAWIPRYSNLINGPGWSLSAEFFFYALFPIVAWRWRGLLFGRPVLGMMIFWLIGCIVGIFLELAVSGDRSLTDYGSKFAGFNPLVRLPEFLMGMGLGALRSRWNGPNWAATALWMVSGAVTVGLLAVGGHGIWKTAFHNSLLSPLFCATILGLSKAQDPIQRCLSNRWTALLGESSYALYILHFPFLVILNFASHRIGHPMEGYTWLSVYLTLSVAFSIAAHLLIERPARDWIRTFFANRMQPDLKSMQPSNR